ncbi:MAG: VOC family protein [Mesorhizobium sp.]
MTTPSYMILFVQDTRASASIYSELFGIEPVYLADDFVLFALPHDYRFALWSAADPEAMASAGMTEIAVLVEDYAAVDSAFAQWSKGKVSVLMQPTTQAFGRSFVVTDADGHRTRVMALAENPQ